MRRQISETGPIPPLAARPDVQPTAGQCTSCAEALPEGAASGTRCEPCIRAAWAVLGWGEPPLAAEGRVAAWSSQNGSSRPERLM